MEQFRAYAHYRNSGVTNLIIFTENWCSHGCATDGPAGTHEQEHPDGYQSRQTC